MPPIALTLLAEPLALCRLAPDASTPPWATGGPFVSITRTAAELSIVCSASDVPGGAVASRGWRALRVEGPLDLALVGVMVALARPLADAEVSIFPIATYDTDWLLVPGAQAAAACAALVAAGHTVRIDA